MLYRRRADVSLRHVDNPHEAQAVFRVVQQAQVGDDVLDFLAVVELRPADHRIRNGVAHELFFQHTGLGVGTE